MPVRAEAEVEIKGLSGPLLENVQVRLSLVSLIGRDDVDEVQIRRFHALADQEIRDSLQPFGYYSPVIDGTLTRSKGEWHAVYQVQAGPQTRIAHFDLAVQGEGSDFAALEEVVRSWPLRSGQPLMHADYEQAKTRLLQTAYNAGYIDARYIQAELRVYPERAQAEVALVLDTGPRWYFGEVKLEASGLDEQFLRRYVRIFEGQPFDPPRVLETQFALTDLSYFQTVEIIPDRANAENQRIPLTIRTTPRPLRRHEIGLGYGTDTGARLSAATEFRRIGQTGHKLRTEIRLSAVKNTLGGEYSIPLGRIPGESLSLKGASESERFSDGESLKYIIGASLNRQPGEWNRRVYLEYHHEESDLSGILNTSDLVIPGVSLTRTEADDPIHTRRGWFFFGDVHGATRNALSSATFLQARVLLRSSYPLGERIRFLTRAEYGADITDDFGELPPSQRFYAGGDQSVRGYGYQSLGPRDARGVVTGGKYLMTLSGEAEMRVWNNWGGAVFIDAGGVDSDIYPRLFRGVGAGVRYRAPIGEVNIDLAHPLDGDRRGIRLHLSVRVGL